MSDRLCSRMPPYAPSLLLFLHFAFGRRGDSVPRPFLRGRGPFYPVREEVRADRRGAPSQRAAAGARSVRVRERAPRLFPVTMEWWEILMLIVGWLLGVAILGMLIDQGFYDLY